MRIFLTVLLFVFICRNSISQNLQKQKVSEGVYAFIGPDPTNDWVDGNSTVIIGESGVLVVDANLVAPSSKDVAEFVKEITLAPVKYILVTHWHYDHYLGAESFKNLYPGLDIISHTETKRIMLNNIKRYLSVVIKTFEAEVDSTRAALLRGTKEDGVSLTDYEKKRSEQMLKDAGYYMDALKKAVFIPPTITFESEMNVSLGNRDVHILHYGRGNTPGDAFAYLPKEKILVTGDLLVYPIPYAFSCYPSEWIKTLKKMSLLDAEIVIPGHGEVQYNKVYLSAVIDALEEITGQVSKFAADGMSLDEVKKAVNFDELKTKLAGNDEGKRWAFDNYFIEPIIPRAYQEAKGTL